MHQQICVQDEFEMNALNIHEHSSAFLSRMTEVLLLPLRPYVCCLQPLEDSYHMNDTHWVGWKKHKKNHWSHQLDMVHAPLCAYHFPSKGETSVELLQSHDLTKIRWWWVFRPLPILSEDIPIQFLQRHPRRPKDLSIPTGLILLSWNRLNNPRANPMIVVFVINLVIPKSLTSCQTSAPHGTIQILDD